MYFGFKISFLLRLVEENPLFLWKQAFRDVHYSFNSEAKIKTDVTLLNLSPALCNNMEVFLWNRYQLAGKTDSLLPGI
jgi:hypothetical protein